MTTILITSTMDSILVSTDSLELIGSYENPTGSNSVIKTIHSPIHKLFVTFTGESRIGSTDAREVILRHILDSTPNINPVEWFSSILSKLNEKSFTSRLFMGCFDPIGVPLILNGRVGEGSIYLANRDDNGDIVPTSTGSIHKDLGNVVLLEDNKILTSSEEDLLIFHVNQMLLEKVYLENLNRETQSTVTSGFPVQQLLIRNDGTFIGRCVR